MLRKLAGAAALSVGLALAGCSGKDAAPAEGDMALGAPEGAKVTVVEYASVTCVHCAAWQKETWPGFKAKYVDTNKVRYVFRELPTPPQDVSVAGFLVARCAGADKYFDVVHQYLADQEALFSGATPPRDWLMRTANAAGLNASQFEACISDKAGIAAFETRVQSAFKAGVTGTPAFFVNDQRVQTPGGEGASLADLSAAIDAALAK